MNTDVGRVLCMKWCWLVACWPEVHAVIFIRDKVALLLVSIFLLVPHFLIVKIHKNDQLSLIAQTACMDLAAQENPFAPLGHT